MVSLNLGINTTSSIVETSRAGVELAADEGVIIVGVSEISIVSIVTIGAGAFTAPVF
jgi:hypothetical protein